MTIHARPTFSLLVLLASHLAACGGGSDGGEGGSAGDTGTTMTTSSGGSGGSSTASNGGTPSSGGSGGTAGNAGGDAGGGSGGSTTTTSSGSGGSSGQSIACENMNCALPGNHCCFNYNEPEMCIMPGGDCTYGVVLACDGPEDCGAGEVCCATLYTKGVGNAYESVQCAATCTGKDFRVVCGASGDCPAGQTCGTSDMLPPYLDCK
jgi:hypothetical protein